MRRRGYVNIAARGLVMNEKLHSADVSSAPTGEVLITAQDISINFHNRPVLSRVSFRLRRGEIVTVIGPNGGGKTSLLKAILGLRPITSGKFKKKDGLKIGYVPQRFFADKVLPITVARFLVLTRPASVAQIEQALHFTGAGQLRNRAVHDLSGGELQRVLLARALLHEPDLLILDEPVQGVDFTGQAALYELIDEIRRRTDCGVMLVSHDLHFVMKATDWVLCLNGHVCCEGRPEAVSRHPEYEKLFGGGAQDFAVYAHHHDHVHEGVPDRQDRGPEGHGHGGHDHE